MEIKRQTDPNYKNKISRTPASISKLDFTKNRHSHNIITLEPSSPLSVKHTKSVSELKNVKNDLISPFQLDDDVVSVKSFKSSRSTTTINTQVNDDNVNQIQNKNNKIELFAIPKIQLNVDLDSKSTVKSNSFIDSKRVVGKELLASKISNAKFEHFNNTWNYLSV